ncbi:MAG: hypothetical protein GX221_11735 [Candidatus Riflebacteria bacterium]|mgnify:CR=1 FL=1|nr:hypothetical protein [Candidatus Riflebacteria bacterium]
MSVDVKEKDKEKDKDKNRTKVLITGMGASFGLLYSAIKLVEPDIVMLLTSDKFEQKAIEVKDKAGFVRKQNLKSKTSSFESFIMKDVFCGFDEADLLVTRMFAHLSDKAYTEGYKEPCREDYESVQAWKDELLNVTFDQAAVHNYRLFVNLTGGTTAMQWVMQAAYEKALREGFDVERIAFVDRRPTVEQQANPFVVGELIEVEKLISK